MIEALDDMPLDQVMRRWPQTVRLFIEWRLQCVGCPIADFHTIVEAAEEHGYGLDDLRSAVRLAIEDGIIATAPPRARRRSAAAGADRE